MSQHLPTRIAVKLSPTVQRYYRACGVNADLLDLCAPDFPWMGQVDRDRAYALLGEAEQFRRRADAPRGTPKAFTALVEHLREALGFTRPLRALHDQPAPLYPRTRIELIKWRDSAKKDRRLRYFLGAVEVLAEIGGPHEREIVRQLFQIGHGGAA